jgi:hypothetical protein
MMDWQRANLTTMKDSPFLLGHQEQLEISARGLSFVNTSQKVRAYRPPLSPPWNSNIQVNFLGGSLEFERNIT